MLPLRRLSLCLLISCQPAEDKTAIQTTSPPLTTTGSGSTTGQSTPCATPLVWFADLDGDGWGDPYDTVEACEPPTNYVDNDGDCDDTDSAVSPDEGYDACDGVDQDCDGLTDEDHRADWWLATLALDGIFEVDVATGATSQRIAWVDGAASTADTNDLGVLYARMDDDITNPDACTGDISVVGSPARGLGGMAFRQDGNLVGVDNDTDDLVVLDASNAAVLTSVPLPFDSGASGMAWSCRDEVLYLLNEADKRLYTVDQDLNVLGWVQTAVPLSVVGLEYDASTNTLLVAGEQWLHRLDPITGNHMPIGPIGLPANDLVWVPPCP